MSDIYKKAAALDGWTDQSCVRSRMFKKTKVVGGSNNPGDVLNSGTEYELIDLPRGFIPEYVVVNVLEANAASATLTVKAKFGAAGSTAAINDTATAAMNSTGLKMVAFKKGTAGLDPAVCDTGAKLSVSASANIDARFEVICVGHATEPAVLAAEPAYVQ